MYRLGIDVHKDESHMVVLDDPNRSNRSHSILLPSPVNIRPLEVRAPVAS